MPATDYTPTVDEFAVRVYARTVNTSGVPVGTFDDTTIPTGAQAQILIGDAAAMVSSQIGADLPEVVWPIAKYAVIARAAMGLERSFYKEEASTEAGPIYQAWEAEYQAAMLAVKTVLDVDQPNRPRFGSIALVSDSTTCTPPWGDWSGAFGWPFG